MGPGGTRHLLGGKNVMLGVQKGVLVAETRDWGSEREAGGCKHAAGAKYVVVGFKAWLGFEMGSGGWRTECWVLE